jgi:hypothetical protein
MGYAMEKTNYPSLANVSPNTVSAVPQKKSRLPFVALMVTFGLPLLLYEAASFVRSGPLKSALAYAMLFSPIAGMLLAVISLCLGKKRIGRDGVTTSLVVLLVPIICVAALFAFLVFFTYIKPINLDHM